MERLTKHLSNGEVIHNCGKCPKVNEKNFCSEKNCAVVILNRLAELEEKLENGQLREINNKPLIIEELKKLSCGDWLWIERPQYKEGDKGYYYQIASICIDGLVVWIGSQCKAFMFQDYGECWVAYKNKEEAEINSKETKI